jgi:N-acetylglucosamine-6-phosphate deacetylase
MKSLLLSNCRLFDHPQPISTDILIEEGHIKAIGKIPPQPEYQVVEVHGQIVAPGFIDIHIQGAGGCDILDNTDEALATISRTLARFGVTGFLATTVIKPEIKHEHLSRAAAAVGQNLGGARLLGIHLEGPFINPIKRGGIAPTAIAPFSPHLLAEILQHTGDKLKIMTIAPEIEGGQELIRLLTQKGIIASLGHTNADYPATQQAIAAGVRHVTHIFNAMPPLNHRAPGPIAAIFEAPEVTVQIISDGVHVHPAIVNLLAKNIGSKRCICISDGIQALGLPNGNYHYNGQEYIAKDGVACYPDGTLIGTALAVSQIAQRFKQFTNCSLPEAINTVALNPARLLGLERIGKIQPGYLADLAIITADFTTAMTLVQGEIVYQRAELFTKAAGT